jgi:LacI family transcriptional regulator
VSARALASGRTGIIGLLAHGLDSQFFLSVIRGVDQQLAADGYDILLATTHDRQGKEAQYIARLSHGMVDGLLVILPRGLPDWVEQLRADAFPFVLIDYDDEAPGCDMVNAANRAGTRAAIGHLVELGHRRIGLITGTPSVGSTHERIVGWRETLTAAGIPVPEDLIIEGDFLEPRGRAAAGELLARPDPPTAIFASSDAAAFGVIRAARERGLRVPEDLSVVGFDDVPEAEDHVLTTVRQPLQEMGRAAARRLMELLADPGSSPRRIVLDTELVVRGTTGPAPRGRQA